MNPLNHFTDSGVLDQTMETRTSTQAQHQWKQMDSEGRKAAVHEEMNRMNQLPANSTYATHRLRVLNKILQLISIQHNGKCTFNKSENYITRCGVGVAFCWALSMNKNPTYVCRECRVWYTICKSEHMLGMRRLVEYRGSTRCACY